MIRWATVGMNPIGWVLILLPKPLDLSSATWLVIFLKYGSSGILVLGFDHEGLVMDRSSILPLDILIHQFQLVLF